MERQLKVMDRLLTDKTELTRKCEGLAADLDRLANDTQVRLCFRGLPATMLRAEGQRS